MWYIVLLKPKTINSHGKYRFPRDLYSYSKKILFNHFINHINKEAFRFIFKHRLRRGSKNIKPNPDVQDSDIPHSKSTVMVALAVVRKECPTIIEIWLEAWLECHVQHKNVSRKETFINLNQDFIYQNPRIPHWPINKLRGIVKSFQFTQS